jgi:hypothetical protein
LNLHRQVGDLLMPQPLAILNDEELHWLGDLGLPNQRRWLNHRTLGDEHRRTFPPPREIISQEVLVEKWVLDVDVLCFGLSTLDLVLCPLFLVGRCLIRLLA